MQDMQVQFLGREDPLEKGIATQFQYSWPGGSRGLRSLVGYGPQGRKKSDTTEVTEHTHTQLG